MARAIGRDACFSGILLVARPRLDLRHKVRKWREDGDRAPALQGFDSQGELLGITVELLEERLLLGKGEALPVGTLTEDFEELIGHAASMGRRAASYRLG